jgi:uncharacterized protein (TIGR02265 family)
MKPLDPADLQKRLAAATHGDMVRGIVFNAAFAVIREQAGEAAAKECDPMKTASRTDFFNYPVADFLKMAWAAAGRLEGKMGGADKVMYAIGHRAGSGVLSSTLGRTLSKLSGQNPRSLLSSTPGGYRATVSYGERMVEWKGDRQCRMLFKRDFLVPAFHCGVLSGAIESLGAKEVQARGWESGFLESQYEVSWRE